jgi:aspartyl-tRNA synthetase
MQNSEKCLSSKQLEWRIGKKIKIFGTADRIRNQGGLLFIDIKEDHKLIQALVIPDNVQAYAMARKISKGNLIEIKGIVKECPESVQSGKDQTKIEIEVEKMAIISTRDEKENESRRILDRSKIISGKNPKNKLI